jgi:hypothetical protein
LVRQGLNEKIIIDMVEYLIVYIDLETFASQSELKHAYRKVKGKEYCIKTIAKEYLLFSIEVLKYVYIDGVKRIEIKEYFVLDDKIKIHMRHNNKQKRFS